LPEGGISSEKKEVRAYRPVAYLGPEGTFSHLLARKRFGLKRELQPCADLSAAFDIIKQHPEALAVVPIENSSGGTIYDTVDLLVREAGRIFVREDLSLDVRLALLGRTGKPVKEIFSHFAPLHHHRDWLAERFPGARICPVASTAVAAALAAKSRAGAALAAPGAAELYELDVLQFPIRPESVNVTRFYIVGQKPTPLASAPNRKPHKTALVFRLKNACGSLHAFLGPFRKMGVNLRMIVSRPIPGQPETYVFFAEVEGALGRGSAHPVGPVAEALAKAGRHAETLQTLGSFPMGRRYGS
jgi:chorismate mutase/prephenate dehydratase